LKSIPQTSFFSAYDFKEKSKFYKKKNNKNFNGIKKNRKLSLLVKKQIFNDKK